MINQAIEKTYTLNDEEISIHDFIQDNEFDSDEEAEILALAPGQIFIVGGGAAPQFILTVLA